MLVKIVYSAKKQIVRVLKWVIVKSIRRIICKKITHFFKYQLLLIKIILNTVC